MVLEAVSPAEAIMLRLHMREWAAEQQRTATPSLLSPLQWAEQNATIVLPTEGRQPFRAYDYQAALLDDTSPRRIVLKARQTGMSNAIAIEALHTALTQPDATVIFVSRNQQLARQLITYCEHTITGLTSIPTLTIENQSELGFQNGSRIISLPANPSTGRGFAATHCYLDEFAFQSYDALIYESIIGTVATGGRLTLLSTANGRANMFFRVWSALEGGEWSRHSVHWSDCPRYRDDPTWEQRTRAGMTRQSFGQEYDLDFVTSGDNVFDPDDLARCKDGYDDDAETCDEILTGWDIGRRQDHTVGISLGKRAEEITVYPTGKPAVTIQRDVWHEVAYDRMLVPYPVVQTSIEDRQRTYGKTWVESNGVGDPVIENLTVKVEPFVTTAKTKVQAIQALQLLIQQGRFKHNNPQLDRELSLYQWDDRALIQDSVMAAAIVALQVVVPEPPQREGWVI